MSEFKWSSQRLERAAMKRWKRQSDRSGRAALRSPGRPTIAESRTDEEVLGSNFCRFGERRGCGDRGRTTSGRGTVVQKGRWHATSDVRAVCTAASGRYLSLPEREEIALLRAQGCTIQRDGPSDLTSSVHGLSRVASKRSHSERRNDVSRNDSTMACRTISLPTEAS